MSAIAAAGRAVVETALVVAAAAAVYQVVSRPQGFWTVAWLAVMFVTLTGVVWGWSALQPKRGDRDG